MAEGRVRGLAAIMFADMVGYTALMQEDEGNARVQRDRHRALLSRIVERFRGEVLQHYGDGTLSIFSSAVEAVECAVEIQREVDRESLIPLRIGVHSGDVARDQDGVYGDGVNVAARIEGLASPGGVMVSGKVFDEIKNHASISAVSVGAVKLKNVGYRLNVFAISNEGITVPSVEEVRRKTEGEGPNSFTPLELIPENGAIVAQTAVGPGEAFLKQVRERAIIPWALIYLAGAWVILQVVGFATERLYWSPLIPQGAALLAFMGFFVTLVVAWFHGKAGRQRVQASEVFIIGVLLVIAGGALTLLPSGRTPLPEVPPYAGLTNLAPDNRPSVAALPLANRGGELETDAYFTDGMHDEILTRLTTLGGLRVISRPSVLEFRDSPLTPAEIARDLGVSYILEGGLLKAGDSVSLNVQLIDPETDGYAWAASYDRPLSVADLLAIQAEIAQAIAAALQAPVTPEERVELARPGTGNLEAYDFFLQGRNYLMRPGYREADLRAAEALFERAIALDPLYARAHASLSRVHGLMFWERFDTSIERWEAQREAAQEALRLEPDLPHAHTAIAWSHYVRGGFREALEEYGIARAGLPNDAQIIAMIGYAHRRLGNWPEVYAAFQEATQLNPRDPTLFYDLGGHSFGFTRRYADAVTAYNRALTLAPDLYDAAIQKAQTLVHWQGQLDTLRAVVAGLPPELHLPEVDLAKLNLALWERDGESLLALVEETQAPVLETQVTYLPRSLYAAWAHRLRGDGAASASAFDSARVLLEPLVPENPNDERILLALGFAYAGLGRPSDAEASALSAARLRLEAGDALSTFRTVENAARVLAQAGLADQAVRYLETVLTNHSPVSVNTLRLDPLLDPIRSHARFRNLLEEYQEPAGN